MNLMKYTFLIITLLLFTTPSSAKTDQKPKKLTIGAYEVPMLVKSADSGTLIDLFKEAAKRANIDYKIEIYPSKRAVRYFMIGELDGLIPAFDESTKFNTVKTDTVYKKNNVVFVRKNSELVNSVDQLAGKTVGLTHGYHYDERLFQDPAIKIEYDQSDMRNIHKLSAGELDAVVVDEKTGLVALNECRVENIHYDPNSTLFGQNVFFAFHNNEDGKNAVNKISEALIEMKKDGTFNNIMESINSKN